MTTTEGTGASELRLDADGGVVAAGAEAERRLGRGTLAGTRFLDLLQLVDLDRAVRMLTAAREFEVAGALAFTGCGLLQVRAGAELGQPDAILMCIEDPPGAPAAAPQFLARTLALALEGAEVGVWMADPSRNMLQADAVAVRLHGLDPADPLSHDLALAEVHPDDRAAVHAALQAAHERGQPFISRHRVLLPDGSVRWMHSQARWVDAEAGMPAQLLGTVADVTAAELAGAAQREHTRLLESVTNSIPALVARWSTGLRCTFSNDRYLAWFGRSREQMQVITMPELLGPELFERNEPYIRGALAGLPQHFERTLTMTDGSVRHTWAQYLPDVEGDTVTGFFALVSDITELKQAQQQLQESQRLLVAEAGRRGQVEVALTESQSKYRSLLQAMLGGYVYCRGIFEQGQLVDYEYLEVNEAYEELMQVQDVVGRRASEIWLGDAQAPCSDRMALFHRVITSGTPERAEAHLEGPDRWLSVAVSRPFDGHLFIVFEDITERKKLIERLSVIFAASAAAIAISRVSDHRFVEVNDAFLAIFGFEREEVLGRTSQELGLWADPDRRRAVVDRVSRDRQARGQTVDIQTKSGAPGRVLASFECVQLGDEPHLVASFLDITELGQAQDRLRASEAEYESLFSNMPLAFISGRTVQRADEGPDFECVKANQLAVNLMGRGHLQGLRASQAVPALWSRHPQLVDLLLRVADTGITERFEVELRTQPRWLGGRVYSSRKGEFAVVFEDSTQRKARDLELQLADARFRRLLNSNIVGVAIGDEAGGLSFANDYYLNVLAATRDELVRGQIQWDRFCRPEDLELDRRALEQVQAVGASVPYEKTLRRRDGSTVAVEIGLAAMPGDPRQVLAILLDVTARVQATDELRQANAVLAVRTREAEDANQAKSRFLSSINHELRTPVHTMLGYTRLLLKRSTGESRRHLEILQSASTQLNRLIDDLLQFSINSQQYSGLRRRAVRLPSFLQQVRELGQMLATEGRNRFELVETGDLPDAVLVDEDRLLQVLQNLLGNACKYTCAGRVTLSVHGDSPGPSAPAPDSCRLAFAVTDTGIGIAAEDQTRIFEAFQRGPATQGQPGLGLGLPIARHWVEAMGGRVQVASIPGQGSRFSFALDLPTTVWAPTRQADTGLMRALAGRQRHLLIVDDLAINREYLRELCADWGIAVTEAASVDTALPLCEANSPPIDAVLVDQIMPGRDGWDLLLELRQGATCPSLPVILISASMPHRPEDFPPELDFDAILAKPFEADGLLDVLRELLDPDAPRHLAPAPAEAQHPDPQPLQALPAADLDRYLELLRLGRVFALGAWARGLAEREPDRATLAALVAQHCTEADLPALHALAQRLRPEV